MAEVTASVECRRLGYNRVYLIKMNKRGSGIGLRRQGLQERNSGCRSGTKSGEIDSQDVKQNNR
jgi:hypothetical protein